MEIDFEAFSRDRAQIVDYKNPAFMFDLKAGYRVVKRYNNGLSVCANRADD
jgi:hypothetical protein